MMITMSIFIVLSFLVNIILVWYCRKLTKQFLFFSDNIENLEIYLETFDSHLKSIYELEMFYGDDTLEGLIEHSKQLLAAIGDFNDSFSMGVDDENEGGLLDGDS